MRRAPEQRRWKKFLHKAFNANRSELMTSFIVVKRWKLLIADICGVWERIFIRVKTGFTQHIKALNGICQRCLASNAVYRAMKLGWIKLEFPINFRLSLLLAVHFRFYYFSFLLLQTRQRYQKIKRNQTNLWAGQKSKLPHKFFIEIVIWCFFPFFPNARILIKQTKRRLKQFKSQPSAGIHHNSYELHHLLVLTLRWSTSWVVSCSALLCAC